MRCMVLAAAFVLIATQTFAHSGHNDAPGDSATASADIVQLSDTTIRNLGIETAPATLAPSGRALTFTATDRPTTTTECRQVVGGTLLLTLRRQK